MEALNYPTNILILFCNTNLILLQIGIYENQLNFRRIIVTHNFKIGKYMYYVVFKWTKKINKRENDRDNFLIIINIF